MPDKNISINSRTSFASIPNKFLRDKNVSAEAKGTACYLQSLPPGFVIHPRYIQKELGYGVRVWRKIADELISYGCLKRHVGGAAKGTFYTFDLWNYKEEVVLEVMENKPTPIDRELQKARVTKSESYKMSPRNNNIYNNKNIITTTTTSLTPLTVDLNDDVVVFLMNEMTKAGIAEKKAMVLMTKYGLSHIREKLEMLIESNAKDSARWLYMAIVQDWKPHKKTLKKSAYPVPSIEETMKETIEWEERVRRANSEESIRAREEAMKIMRGSLRQPTSPTEKKDSPAKLAAV